jgi:alkylation response protein AidB-like acyl-CoA dehydrogenase
MEGYRELNGELPGELEALREGVRGFGRDVLRPAARELDQMADPADAIAPGSPLRRVFRQAYGLGYHVAGLPARLGGLGLPAASECTSSSRSSHTAPSISRSES